MSPLLTIHELRTLRAHTGTKKVQICASTILNAISFADNEWRTQGVFYIQRDTHTGLILCETYHLSAFSVLVVDFIFLPSDLLCFLQNYNDDKRHSIFSNDKLVPPILLGCLLATCLLAFSLLATAVFRHKTERDSQA